MESNKQQATSESTEAASVHITAPCEPATTPTADDPYVSRHGAPNSGYDLAGAHGTVSLSDQALVTAYRQFGTGIPSVAGYGTVTTGYSTASQGEYTDPSMNSNATSDTGIYAAIESVRPASTIV